MIKVKPCPVKQQGFSLLEILVAFTIMAISLGILLKIFSGGVNMALVADEYTTAVQIGESLLAKAGVELPLQPGETSGEEDHKYRWLLQIEPFTTSLTAINTETLPVSLFKVKATVSWGEDTEDDRQVELTTLRLTSNEL